MKINFSCKGIERGSIYSYTSYSMNINNEDAVVLLALLKEAIRRAEDGK